eukprot:12899036-Prorocentrum_lima.AAC.1
MDSLLPSPQQVRFMQELGDFDGDDSEDDGSEQELVDGNAPDTLLNPFAAAPHQPGSPEQLRLAQR